MQLFNIYLLFILYLSYFFVCNSFQLKVNRISKIYSTISTPKLHSLIPSATSKTFLSCNPEVKEDAISLETTKTSKTFDGMALLSYIGATLTQWTLLVSFLHGIEFTLIRKFKSTKYISIAIGILFFFLSVRSRVFSPLDNRRPEASLNDPIFKERLRPSWQPPPLVFPIVWSTIAILRMISSSLVFQTNGYSLLSKETFAFILHLCVGDTWNTINNVENRLGTAFAGVWFVWLSAAFTVFSYYKFNKLAGLILSPLVIWLTIASILVGSIWKVNFEKFNKPSLFPSKEEGPASTWRFPLTSFHR